MGGGEVCGWVSRREEGKQRGKGAVEESTCLAARGHFLIKHCTPSPSTGHLNSNSAAHTRSAGDSLSPSLSPFDCMSLSPSIPRSLSSLGYLIIRQFLAVATYCSGVLGLPDYRVSLKSPKVCTPVCVLRVCASMCVSLILYLASKNGGLDYTVNLWVIIGLQFCSDSSSVE